MTFEVTTPPGVEPITWAELRDHLRLDTDDEQALGERWITTARELVERDTGQALISQTIAAYWDAFEPVLYLPRSPVQSVTTVQYVDAAGATQTVPVADWQLDKVSKPARLAPAPGLDWPNTRHAAFNAVIVTFVAGYGGAGTDVPDTFTQALYLIAGHWFDHREEVVDRTLSRMPLAADNLLKRHFAHRIGA